MNWAGAWRFQAPHLLGELLLIWGAFILHDCTCKRAAAQILMSVSLTQTIAAVSRKPSDSSFKCLLLFFSFSFSC